MSRKVDRRKLHQLLVKHLDKEELRTLCFVLDVDYDSLRGEGKAAKARELVAYLEHHSRSYELVEIGEEQRPDVPWKNAWQTPEKAASTSQFTLPRRLRLAFLAVGLTVAAVLLAIVVTSILRPFPPASDDEFLIIVADFEDRSGGKRSDMYPEQYIYDKLAAAVNQEGKEKGIRVERLEQVVNNNTVISVGQYYRAKLVVWGWYDALSITPYIERIAMMPEYVSSEEGHHLILSELDSIELSTIIIECLPNNVTYIVYLILGISEYTHQAYDPALNSLGYALDLASANDECPIAPGEVYFYLGNVHYYKHVYESALAEYTEATILENAKVYNNRGNTYFKDGKYPQAIADFTKAIGLDPKYEIAYFNRGNTYYQLGDYEEAITDYTQAITISEYASFYNNRGNAYYQCDKYYDALADYDSALELDPEYADAYCNRSATYASKDEYDQALADCTMAIKLVPDNAVFYHLCGFISNEMEDSQSALEYLDTAIELDLREELADVYCDRGEAYKALGQREQAIADFEHCLEETNDPYWQQVARQELEELKGK